jgi:hypothetical protein
VDLGSFLACKGAKNLFWQRKGVNALKMPETLMNTRFATILPKKPSLSRFKVIFNSVFV